ncbi:hypothetical protein BU25DRAFT_458105 [Macroventuria anomochaeta]|uniref:Uncharacterized protein n=1 Tax=Macroventuria anomochaeta TaxID=301207 RepID=A0ACB6S2L6_9PLEO|nr:uncharacterized protein BU25DRAFT_458105 [Macroventuria anomochaeta]KAF2628264.1 hypothetical protein BU25DRAFT_458105 [Macroventuria anomochaeta]
MASPVLTTADGHNTGSSLSGQYDASPHSDSPEIAEDQSPINDVADDQGPKPQPLQKRRRVTRACDECRRKKINTYDQPSNRRRNATPQYIEALEGQLKRAKALLHVVFPTIDLNDPSIDAHLQNGLLPQLPVAAPRPPVMPTDPRLSHHANPQVEAADDSHLEAMVKATGQLDLDEEGNWDYHGHSSGLSFMRGLRQFGDMFQAPPDSSPSLKHRNMSVDPPSPSSPRSPAAPSTALPSGTELPNKKEAISLCENAIIDAGAMQRVVHLPTFYKQLDRMYEIPAESYTNAENSFLPLLYAVLALGKLFSQGEHEVDKSNYETVVDEGFRYFKASRQLLDITDCRDLTSLQAIVFMIQFLQSSAKLSTCYAYIGVALRSALRMGLHRSFNSSFSPIEAETRKRLFWVIRRMDTYVGAMLGLPRFLEDEDIDQDFPIEVDDEYITETEILPMPEGTISVMSAFNAHTRIVQVLSKICRYVYPIKGTQSGGKNSVTYTVKYSKIRELEQDLAQWLDELPMALKPGGEAPPIIIRVQQLLRMAFGHAQLLLYRPFLHYVSSTYKDNTTDQRAFACASACVSVSRNIIHITSEMRRRGLLAGAYWFSMYTTFFAIVSILYFVLENPNSSTSLELLRDAAEGKEVLAYFAKRSMAADRCSSALNSMFERLPEAVKQGRELHESRKRRQDSSPQSLGSRPQLIESDMTMPRRASTFPESHPDSKRTAPGPSLPISQSHYASLGLDPSFNSPSPSNADFLEAVPGLTSTSASASLGQFGALPTRPSFPPTPLSNSFTDPLGLNVPISDISTMMFPSADPLAYPNPPMTTFENKHPQAFDRRLESPSVVGPTSGIDMKSYSAIFAPSSMPTGPPRRHEGEAQLFGPMPMYLMQAAHAQRGHPLQSGSPSMHHIPGQNMQFDELLNQEAWAQSFMDPGMEMPSSRTPFGGNTQFQPPQPGMGGWR